MCFHINNEHFDATGARFCLAGHKLENGNFLKKSIAIFILMMIRSIAVFRAEQKFSYSRAVQKNHETPSKKSLNKKY